MKTAFPEILSSLRREKGISQRQAASELGISQALLSHYENDAREPKLEFVVKACNYYDVPADYMLGRTESRTNDTALLVESVSDDLIALEKHHSAQANTLARIRKAIGK
jgi:transcriptional regulator with XRE-family HTH domain